MAVTKKVNFLSVSIDIRLSETCYEDPNIYILSSLNPYYSRLIGLTNCMKHKICCVHYITYIYIQYIYVYTQSIYSSIMRFFIILFILDNPCSTVFLVGAAFSASCVRANFC